MFTYEIEQLDSHTKIFLKGDLDIDVTEIMEEEIAPALRDGSLITVDFTQVAFVDSSGIGLLISLIRNIRDEGRAVKIVNVSTDVMHVFSMLQLPEILGNDVFQ